ncbi:hypothetical protein SAMN04488005_1256 [Yoonia tamlensis]|uniref:Tellurite resistance protein n=1 Tax=Yoonia tamlensis TaxID=390270 RepID=A0A1I6G959_9RHOB|nr:TrgA family protein [Yoonia tamlensis]SFR38607.1 hypothetical protein SAMN04488005_1256 [Yoonia tamlensis]
MPTAGRLTGAVIYALFGWYIAGIAVPYFPESHAPDFLIPVCAGLGVFYGWRICGTNAGKGYNAATGQGLTMAFLFSVSILYIIGFTRMITRAMRMDYDGPVEAIMASFTETFRVALYFLDVRMIASVVIGAVIGAWITEFVARRYP